MYDNYVVRKIFRLNWFIEWRHDWQLRVHMHNVSPKAPLTATVRHVSYIPWVTTTSNATRAMTLTKIQPPSWVTTWTTLIKIQPPSWVTTWTTLIEIQCHTVTHLRQSRRILLRRHPFVQWVGGGGRGTYSYILTHVCYPFAVLGRKSTAPLLRLVSWEVFITIWQAIPLLKWYEIR